MKIFKLKYFIIAIVVSNLWSCDTEKVDIEPDKASSNTPVNDFVVEPNMSYFINNKQTTNSEEIKAAGNNSPCNVTFNFGKKKVLIFTTKEEFDFYKNSDPKIKYTYDGNDEKDENNKTAIASKTSVVPENTLTSWYNCPMIYVESGYLYFGNSTYFGANTNFFFPLTRYLGTSQQYCNFVSTSISNTGNLWKHVPNPSLGVNNNFLSNTTILDTDFTNILIKNHRNSKTAYVSIFSDRGLSGNSTTFVLSPYEVERAYPYEFPLGYGQSDPNDTQVSYYRKRQITSFNTIYN